MNSSPGRNDSYGSCEFQDNLDLLRQVPFFSGLPLEGLKILAYMCEREAFKAGDFLFRQDDNDGQAVFIISGSAAILHRVQGEDVTIREIGSGEFIGGLTLLNNLPRLFSVRVTEDTVCLILKTDRFISAITQFPDMAAKVTQAVIRSVFQWEERFLGGVTAQCEGCRQRVGVSLL